MEIGQGSRGIAVVRRLSNDIPRGGALIKVRQTAQVKRWSGDMPISWLLGMSLTDLADEEGD